MAPTDLPPSPDIVNVGAGVAGGTAAETLAAAGHEVLIPEAGPRLSRDGIVRAWRRSAETHLVAGYPDPDWAPVPGPADWDDHLIQTGPDPSRQRYVRAVGGTIMGRDPAASVVDADGRVHGADNLCVAASAVFPSAARVNSTPTIAALPLRLADHVDGRLRPGR